MAGKSLLKPSQEFHIHLGDCIEHMAAMPAASVDMSVFSPPFPALYAYCDSASDLGNVDTVGPETKIHFSYFFKALRRVIKPGRVAMVHCAQIPNMKRVSGDGGLHDFRGLLIRLAKRAGFVWEYEWLVRKNPQAQAIRSRSRELQFAGLESDRAATRGCLPDHLLKFRAPGVNEVPINSKGQVSRENWIQWAECTWWDVRETDTVELDGSKAEGDTKHICPLQKEVIRRLVLLFSNPGEIVFSPFTGIGSEGYVALKNDRRFFGCELRQDWCEAARRRCRKAIEAREDQALMFT